MTFYIVYSYISTLGSFPPTKYVEGIYKDLGEAKNRQKVVCGENAEPGINNSVYGNGMTTFINIFPEGDCHIELFTT